jgi:hypothetical protein
MAKNRTGHRPGGGIASRVVKHVTAPKREPRARAINPGGVNQLGNHVGDHVTNKAGGTGYRGEPLIRGSGYNAPVGPTNMMPSSAGAGRQTMHCGSQGTHGSVNPGSPRPNTQRDALENE